jgi:hypothetical protein
MNSSAFANPFLFSSTLVNTSLPDMPPVVTKTTYAGLGLFDLKTGEMHIRDVVQMEGRYLDRTSDMVTGMLRLGTKAGAVTKTRSCYFRVTFLPHVKLRESVYQSSGEPFVGPDGLAMTFKGFVLGGSDHLRAGQYSFHDFDALKQALISKTG